VILLVWSFDTGAYLIGIALGKRKFLAHISPSKSYWGLFGGVVACTAVAVAGFWALGQPLVLGLGLGPLIGLVAQAGDLAESMLKRAAGAKDSGGLIRGTAAYSIAWTRSSSRRRSPRSMSRRWFAESGPKPAGEEGTVR